MMTSGVSSLTASGDIRSLRVSSANSTVIGDVESFAKAEILVRAPSSSRILDLIFLAI